jgi:hypothetical protein
MNNYAYNNSADQRSVPNSQGNIFFTPSSQTPSLFGQNNNSRPSYSNDRGVRNSRNARTRIQWYSIFIKIVIYKFDGEFQDLFVINLNKDEVG